MNNSTQSEFHFNDIDYEPTLITKKWWLKLKRDQKNNAGIIFPGLFTSSQARLIFEIVTWVALFSDVAITIDWAVFALTGAWMAAGFILLGFDLLFTAVIVNINVRYRNALYANQITFIENTGKNYNNYKSKPTPPGEVKIIKRKITGNHLVEWFLYLLIGIVFGGKVYIYWEHALAPKGTFGFWAPIVSYFLIALAHIFVTTTTLIIWIFNSRIKREETRIRDFEDASGRITVPEVRILNNFSYPSINLESKDFAFNAVPVGKHKLIHNSKTQQFELHAWGVIEDDRINDFVIAQPDPEHQKFLAMVLLQMQLDMAQRNIHQ